MKKNFTNKFFFQEIIKEVKSGVEVGFLCDLGNKIIEDRVSKIFKKEKELQKGFYLLFIFICIFFYFTCKNLQWN